MRLFYKAENVFPKLLKNLAQGLAEATESPLAVSASLAG